MAERGRVRERVAGQQAGRIAMPQGGLQQGGLGGQADAAWRRLRVASGKGLGLYGPGPEASRYKHSTKVQHHDDSNCWGCRKPAATLLRPVAALLHPLLVPQARRKIKARKPQRLDGLPPLILLFLLLSLSPTHHLES